MQRQEGAFEVGSWHFWNSIIVIPSANKAKIYGDQSQQRHSEVLTWRNYYITHKSHSHYPSVFFSAPSSRGSGSVVDFSNSSASTSSASCGGGIAGKF